MDPIFLVWLAGGAALGFAAGRLGFSPRPKAREDEALRRARGLLNALPDSWLVLDANEQLIEVRIAPRPGSQAPLPKLKGRSAEDFFSREVVDKLRTAREACLRDGREQSFEFEWRLRGEQRAASARVVPLGDGEVVVVVQDVSEQKLTERTLRETKEFAESMLGARTDAFARLSHDVRNQVTGVLTVTDMLLTRDAAPVARRYLETIQRCGDNIVELVTNMMELSRIERGTMSLHPGRVALGELVEGVVDLLRPQAAEGVAVTVELDASAPREVLVDGVRLRQIALNLVHNAVKFTAQGSVQVQVRAAPGERFALRVCDTGPGIAKDALPRIFDAYYQAHEARQGDPRRAGSGLGLAIVRELSRALGGEVRVESEEGRGTTFEVTLPVRPG